MKGGVAKGARRVKTHSAPHPSTAVCLVPLTTTPLTSRPCLIFYLLQVVHGFDVDVCGVLYDGDEVWATSRAIRALHQVSMRPGA